MKPLGQQSRAAEPATERVELTILMPCLNETETLAACINKARSFIEQSKVSAEIVVADNGSTDGSQELARSLGAVVVNVPIRGYGAALHEGAVNAKGRYVIMGDSDDSYDFSDLSAMLERLRAGDELVMGNRFRGNILPGAMPWKNRYIGNPVLTAIGRLFFRSPVGDFHCGLRGFSKEAFERMNLRTEGMEFASEMVIKATLLEMKMSEVPITLKKDGRSRPPHLRPWRDGWRHLRFMLLYCPRWLFLYPGLLLMALGLVAVIALVQGPVRIGRIGLDVHTLLYCAMAVLVGFQCVLFSAFARVFAEAEGLAPPSDTLRRRVGFISLETGLALGFLLLVAGVGGTIAAVAEWGEANFGALDPTLTLRAVIPSMMSFTLGVETVLGSFFLSMLGLRLRRAR